MTATRPVAAQAAPEFQADPASGAKPTERILIERILLQLYPRLRRHDLFPWKLLHGPLIPDFLVRHTPSHLRRIVVIGCGDGVLCNVIALLFPAIEVIGIDRSAALIAQARQTVGDRANLKFICGNAATMLDIPCDRIIYHRCLEDLQQDFAFRKLLVKTTQWLVNEGDFVVVESPLRLLLKPRLLKDIFRNLTGQQGLEACLRKMLAELGHINPLIYRCRRLPFIASEIFYRFSKELILTAMLGVDLAADTSAAEDDNRGWASWFAPSGNRLAERNRSQANIVEWQDVGDQSVHSVLGFLFSDAKQDFSGELV